MQHYSTMQSDFQPFIHRDYQKQQQLQTLHQDAFSNSQTQWSQQQQHDTTAQQNFSRPLLTNMSPQPNNMLQPPQFGIIEQQQLPQATEKPTTNSAMLPPSDHYAQSLQTPQTPFNMPQQLNTFNVNIPSNANVDNTASYHQQLFPHSVQPQLEHTPIYFHTIIGPVVAATAPNTFYTTQSYSPYMFALHMSPQEGDLPPITSHPKPHKFYASQTQRTSCSETPQ